MSVLLKKWTYLDQPRKEKINQQCITLGRALIPYHMDFNKNLSSMATKVPGLRLSRVIDMSYYMASCRVVFQSAALYSYSTS